MNKRWGLVLAAGVGAILAACSTPPAAPISTGQTVALIPTGAPVLRCREACLQPWRTAQPEAADLLRRGRWRDLAALLVRVGYQDDLSLYYLARAAQGMGYPDAAAKYYRQSIALSGTAISCVNLSRQCGGLALPRAAEMRLAEIARRPIRRRLPIARRPEAPVWARQPAAAPVEGPAAAPTPLAPLPETAPPPTAAPPVRPPAPGTSDFIEPPPAPK
ncbi:MAG TPA: hypothetical protein VND87_12590 [Stellaceae bacterium]|nr:hypothetical protein [Stellaceae bacterium]